MKSEVECLRSLTANKRGHGIASCPAVLLLVTLLLVPCLAAASRFSLEDAGPLTNEVQNSSSPRDQEGGPAEHEPLAPELPEVDLVANVVERTAQARHNPRSRCPVIKFSLPNGRVRQRARNNIARFICDPGFERIGSRFATCTRGQWNNAIPICAARGCPRITPPANGRALSLYRGSSFHFVCNPGFELNGPRTVYCVDGRRWNGSVPRCEAPRKDVSLSCDFEDGLCDWEQDPDHNLDWRRHQLLTPSGADGTGPRFDHTFGPNSTGYYLYLEASSPATARDEGRLFSGVLRPEGADFCFSFFYHMLGEHIGSLRIYVKAESQVLDEMKPAWNASGSQGSEWQRGQLQVRAAEPFQIVLSGTIGRGYLGDIAVDDLALQPGNCSWVTPLSESGLESAAAGSDEEGGDDESGSAESLEEPRPPATCEDRCGNSSLVLSSSTNSSASAGDCSCQASCRREGDCCADFARFCGSLTNGTFSDSGNFSRPTPDDVEASTRSEPTATEAPSDSTPQPRSEKSLPDSSLDAAVGSGGLITSEAVSVSTEPSSPNAAAPVTLLTITIASESTDAEEEKDSRRVNLSTTTIVSVSRAHESGTQRTTEESGAEASSSFPTSSPPHVSEAPQSISTALEQQNLSITASSEARSTTSELTSAVSQDTETSPISGEALSTRTPFESGASDANRNLVFGASSTTLRPTSAQRQRTESSTTTSDSSEVISSSFSTKSSAYSSEASSKQDVITSPARAQTTTPETPSTRTDQYSSITSAPSPLPPSISSQTAISSKLPSTSPMPPTTIFNVLYKSEGTTDHVIRLRPKERVSGDGGPSDDETQHLKIAPQVSSTATSEIATQDASAKHQSAFSNPLSGEPSVASPVFGDSALKHQAASHVDSREAGKQSPAIDSEHRVRRRTGWEAAALASALAAALALVLMAVQWRIRQHRRLGVGRTSGEDSEMSLLALD